MYQPWNALEAPRFTGPRTYARLPWVKDLSGVEAAVYGLPWDGGTSFRSGARSGPEAIRSASGMIRTYNPVQKVQVFGALSTIDYGDAPTAPGYIDETLARMERFISPLAEAGVVGIAMGGDHSVSLAELRALARVHGPSGSCTSTRTPISGIRTTGCRTRTARCSGERSSRASSIRRACSRPVSADHSTERTTSASRTSSGSRRFRGSSSPRCPHRDFAAGARTRVAGRPAFLSLDVDFVDAGHCPGTGTPEIGGPTSFQAIQYLRSLADIEFVGYDVVEVAPQYDGPGQVTALFAAGAIFEMLSMIARRRRSV